MPYIGQRPATGEANSFKILDDISNYTLTFGSSDVNVSADTITAREHRFVTGQRVTYGNGGGTAPTGLSNGAVYYIIVEDRHTFKLATNASNAVAGTAIDITAAGAGAAHTINVAFDSVNTKFKATHTNGTKADISQSGQLMVSVNGVLQQPHDNTTTPSTGYATDHTSTIIFSAAPAAGDQFFGRLIASNFATFDISDNTVDNFTGDGSTSTFTLSKTPPNNESILVTIDGVVQYPDDNAAVRAYTVSENVLDFASAPGSAVEIQVRHIGFAGASTAAVSGFYGRTGNAVLKNTDDIVFNNATASGTVQAANVTVTGDLTVNGTTTTLDTDLIGVDKLEVAANNTTVAAAITQTGSGDILNLYDGGTEVFSVLDGGAVRIGGNAVSGAAAGVVLQDGTGVIATRSSGSSPVFRGYTQGDNSANFTVKADGKLLLGTETEGNANADNLTVADSANSGITIRSGSSNIGSIFFSDATSGGGEYAGFMDYNHSSNQMSFGTAETTRVTIASNGRVGIATNTPGAILDVEGTLLVGTSGVANGNTTLNGHVIVDRTGVSGSNPWLTVKDSGSSVFYVNGAGSVYANGVNATGGITAGTSGQGDGNSNIYGYLSVDRNGIAASNTWFQVKNGSTPIIYANGQGKVGIGTDSPTANFKLDINGDLTLGESGGSDNTYIDQKQNGSLNIINSGRQSSTGGIRINKTNSISGDTTYYRDLEVYDGKNNLVLLVDGSSSNIGISEATPDSKVDILHSTVTNTATENLIHLRTDPGGSYVTRGLYVKIGRDGQYDNSAAHYDIVGSAGNSGFHAFEVQGDEKLRITKDGKLLIGSDTGSVHGNNFTSR